jgi:hypothetical protein
MMPIEIEQVRSAARSSGGHQAGVEMGQQAGFVGDGARHLAEIGKRGGVAGFGQRGAGGGIARLGHVPQREQCFAAAGAFPGAGDLQDLVAGEIGAVDPRRRRGEGAIVADVAAQPGQRDEYLARPGDQRALRRERDRFGERDQVAGRSGFDLRERWRLQAGDSVFDRSLG